MFRFGAFTLDIATRQLLRDESEIHLSPKAFELLARLILDRPRVVSKAVLQQHLWPDTFVADANLSNLMAEVRDALDDRARAPVYIRTVHGFGYAFCGKAESSSDAEGAKADAPACWLEWGQHRFALSVGENVIGRDADVAIRLDASTVSRRHARVIIDAQGAQLEDFGSKNGTFRGNERVVSRVELVDGDAIRIGSLLVTFRARFPGSTTETQANR